METKKKHGGARQGAGRKKLRDEEKVIKLSITAITEQFGSEVDFFKDIATHAKGGSFNHAKLLAEYAYGKPKETVVSHNVNFDVVKDQIDYSKLTGDVLEAIHEARIPEKD